MDYLLAIDEGTTGTTAVVMDSNFKRVGESSLDFPQHFPKPGWVEHDLNDIWKAVVQTVSQATASIDRKNIAAIGITNQRETICFWDRKTLAPLGRAIVWQDRRSTQICEALKSQGLEPEFQKKTGLLLDPYFSGTKVAWALKNWPDVQTAHQSGRLAVGTIDSFLIAKISNGKVHATEASNASRTLAFDLHQLKWCAELCKQLHVPLDIWPQVRSSTGIFCKSQSFAGLPDEIPVSGVLGDQQAALLGQACIREGLAKCTYGTGAFLLLNTGPHIVASQHRLLTTVAWQINGQTTYALEGSAFIAGAAVQWLRDGLGLIHDASEIEALARKVPTSDGVVFVPALTGLGAPHWDPKATGLFTGLTRGTTSAHLARAVLEGIAFQNVDILKAMESDLGHPLAGLNVDGGAATNEVLMQFQADVLGITLKRPQYLETTSLGALFAAGLGIGLFRDLNEVEKTWQKDREFNPSIDTHTRAQWMSRWHRAVAQATMEQK